MPYQPERPPRIDNLQDMYEWVQRELIAIAREQAETTALDLRPSNAAPTRPRNGLIAYADGTSWDPGFGAGLYVYHNGAWTQIGLAESGTWTPLMSFATSNGDMTFSGHILGSPEGYYLRMGRLVFYSFNFSVGGFSQTTASGHLQITGFPFTFDPAVDFQMGVMSYEGIKSDVGGLQEQCNTFVRGAQPGFRFSICGVDGFVNEVVGPAHVANGNLVLLATGVVRISPP